MLMTLHPRGHVVDHALFFHWRDLAKQIKLYQITIDVLEGRITDKFQNIPAVNAWRGHIPACKYYYNQMVDAWRTFHHKTYNGLIRYEDIPPDQLKFPGWISSYEVCHSHRNYLLKHRPKFYGRSIKRRKDAGKFCYPNNKSLPKRKPK